MGNPLAALSSLAKRAKGEGGASASAPGSQASGAARYFEEKFKPDEIKPEQGVEDPRKEENSPSTVGGIVRRYYLKTADLLKRVPSATYHFTIAAVRYLWEFLVESIRNPASLKERWEHVKKVAKDEFHHYALGTKLLWSDMKTSWSIVRRLLNGHTLTRRERRQLTRTTADLFRLVPFAFFVIVPFMELLLPVALKIFPNMLPSTYKDNLKEEENMKRELKVRLGMAGFLKDIVEEIAKKKVKSGEEASAHLLYEFVEKARHGYNIGTTDISRFARLFKDELTLDNMSRPQLASMCVYMGLRPYGADNFLRFQLRAKLRNLKDDDQRIVWEGIDNMNKEELREACRERGMRAYGLTQLGYRRQLQQWLDLSINKDVPISLLILSRAFTLDSKFADPAAAVADSISSLDKDVVNEVLLEVASGAELKSPDIRARKLESIERQNELIEEERKREEARRKKAEAEKKRAEEASAAAEPAVPASVHIGGGPVATASAPAGPAEAPATPQADTEVVKAAVDHGVKMTETTAEDAPKAHAIPAAEKLPAEPVLTEKEVVSEAMPSLGGDKPAVAQAQAQAVDTGKAEAEAAAGKAAEAKPTEDPMLTVAEVKALRTLVKESSVEQEKSVLAQLKAQLQAQAQAEAEDGGKVTDSRETLAAALAAAQLQYGGQQAATPSAADADVETKGTQEGSLEGSKLDKSLERMRQKVASMLDKIEVTIDKIDSRIGDKLHKLDKDKDGILSTAELSEVIFHVLNTRVSEEEAAKIAQMLDKDADGVLTVHELLEWIEQKEKLLEELGHEDEEISVPPATVAAAAPAPDSSSSPATATAAPAPASTEAATAAGGVVPPSPPTKSSS